MSSLYDLPLDGVEFTNYCGGNLQSEHESCIGIARIPGTDGFVLRDTKPEGADRELRVTADELRDFVRGAASDVGLTL